jgi:ribosomal protein S17E
MKKVIQKAIIKTIQRPIVEYYCDKCKKKFEKGERKYTWYLPGHVEAHYHKECQDRR